ncbi:MAG: hypothetical protein ACI976_000720, partial [Aureispira sp.]
MKNKIISESPKNGKKDPRVSMFKRKNTNPITRINMAF